MEKLRARIRFYINVRQSYEYVEKGIQTGGNFIIYDVWLAKATLA